MLEILLRSKQATASWYLTLGSIRFQTPRFTL